MHFYVARSRSQLRKGRRHRLLGTIGLRVRSPWPIAIVNDSQAIVETFDNAFGQVSKIDLTDGVRITFNEGEIVHLRPSGNAPEFRCYTESDSEARVREMNEICMNILEGWRTL
ncbi:MAG: hypothetical protein AAES65_05190 [Candidatus Thiodiazotropha sp. (ex. Lucinoma kazani)]